MYLMGQGFFVLLSGQADTYMAHMNGQIKVPACIGVDCGAETLSSKMIGGVLLVEMLKAIGILVTQITPTAPLPRIKPH